MTRDRLGALVSVDLRALPRLDALDSESVNWSTCDTVTVWPRPRRSLRLRPGLRVEPARRSAAGVSCLLSETRRASDTVTVTAGPGPCQDRARLGSAAPRLLTRIRSRVRAAESARGCRCGVRIIDHDSPARGDGRPGSRTSGALPRQPATGVKGGRWAAFMSLAVFVP